MPRYIQPLCLDILYGVRLLSGTAAVQLPMFLEANPMNSRFSKPGSVESLLYSDHGALTRLITLSLHLPRKRRATKCVRFERKSFGAEGKKGHIRCDSDPSSVKSALSLDI